MQHINSNLTFPELERIAYANGDARAANLYAAADYGQQTTSDIISAIVHIEEAKNCMLGEDFLVPLIERVRDMASKRVTKQDLLAFINEMEDFQSMVSGDVEYARDELRKALQELE